MLVQLLNKLADITSYEVLNPSHTFFDETGLRAGDKFGKAGLMGAASGSWEVNATNESSPSFIRIQDRDLSQERNSCYETASGGLVFFVVSLLA